MEEKNFETMGTVKSTQTREEQEFFTCEEAKKFTRDDFDRNPRLFRAVVRSMEKW